MFTLVEAPPLSTSIPAGADRLDVVVRPPVPIPIPNRLAPLWRLPGYLAGSDGRIWSIRPPGPGRPRLARPRPLAVQPGRDGYLKVDLYDVDGRRQSRKVHLLILEAFAGYESIASTLER